MFGALLDRFGRFFGIDARYAARGASFLTFLQIWSALIAFILTIAFANLLDQTAYGTYRYILSAYTLLSLIALPGMDVAVTRAVARGWGGALKEGYLRKMYWGFLGTLVTWGVAFFYYTHANPMLALLFFIAGAMMPFNESAEVLLAFFNGAKSYRTWTGVEMATQFFSAAALIATMFLTHNVALIVLAYFIPYILIRTGAVVFVTVRQHAGTIQEDLRSYARSMSVFQILNSAGTSLDQVVLFHFLGAAQLAIFSLAQAMPIRIQSFLKISGTLAFPKYAERDPKDIVRTLPYKMLMFGLMILFGCIVYIIFAPLLFHVFFPRYDASIPYTQILIFYTLSAVTYPFSSYLMAHKKVVQNYIYGGVSLLCKIIALAIFVPLYGIWGGVISVFASILSSLVITTILIVRERRAL